MRVRRWLVLTLCCAVCAIVYSMDVDAEGDRRSRDIIYDESLDIEFDEEPEFSLAQAETASPATRAAARPGFWRRAASFVFGPSRIFAEPKFRAQAVGMPTTRWASASGVSVRGSRALGVSPRAAASSGRDVLANIGCEFYIYDEDDYTYDITYEARVFDPDDNQIAYKTNWAADKSHFGSSLTAPVTNPITGTYKCTIQWTIDTYTVPLRQKNLEISYVVPTGETTTAAGFATMTGYRTAGMWNVVLTYPGSLNFKGRHVDESLGSGTIADSCHYSLSAVPHTNTTTLPTDWVVKSDNSLTGRGGYAGNDGDWVGWTEGPVAYYRGSTGGPNMAPCGYSLTQDMTINRPGASDVTYRTGIVLEAGITSTKVWSKRDGQYQERVW